ncbi:MAG: helix-turn-helix domain-containing protein [Planctomycetes bacterium]|nr:helix-turn-helix domain-containing protein [Planctomycetota bacterium]
MKEPNTAIKQKYTSGQPGHVRDAEYFYYDAAPDYNKELAIVCGGYEKCAPDFELNRSDYPYYFVKYTINGKGTLEINSQTLPLRPGILTGFEPGTPHHYKSDPDDPMEHIFITFVGSQASELFKKSGLSESHCIDIDNRKEVLAIFQKVLFLGLQKPQYSQDICLSYLRILMLEQTASLTGPGTNISLSMSTDLQCKQYIDLNFSSINSPRQVASACSIDVRYMASLFKKHCHIPPSRYIMRLKLNKAAYLMLATDQTIKEIGYQVGFDNPYHFSKNFKQFYGRSPNNYRLKHKQI